MAIATEDDRTDTTAWWTDHDLIITKVPTAHLSWQRVRPIGYDWKLLLPEIAGHGTSLFHSGRKHSME